jgi:hypothetical protein
MDIVDMYTIGILEGLVMKRHYFIEIYRLYTMSKAIRIYFLPQKVLYAVVIFSDPVHLPLWLLQPAP